MIIGIDPDVDKNGIAIYNGHEITLHNFALFELYDYLCKRRESIGRVVIEKGELNNSLWNAKGGFKTSLNIAMKTGKNFDRTDVIAEMCQHLNITYEYYIPLSAKYNHEFIVRYFKIKIAKSNQEQRDAVRCIAKYVL